MRRRRRGRYPGAHGGPPGSAGVRRMGLSEAAVDGAAGGRGARREAPPGALLEREGELARIGGSLARARQGRGGLVLVEGPAGMGKSALLADARALAEAAGMQVLRSRGAELEREFGYGVVRQLL